MPAHNRLSLQNPLLFVLCLISLPLGARADEAADGTCSALATQNTFTPNTALQGLSPRPLAFVSSSPLLCFADTNDYCDLLNQEHPESDSACPRNFTMLGVAVFGGLRTPLAGSYGLSPTPQIAWDYDYSNSLWVLDLNARRWLPVRANGPSLDNTWPSPRAAATSVAFHLKLIGNCRFAHILFGGRNQTTIFDETWLVPLARFSSLNNTEAAATLLPLSPSPSARFGHVSVRPDQSTTWYIYGGFSATLDSLADVWALTMQEYPGEHLVFTWTELQLTTSTQPSARGFAYLTQLDVSKFIMAGGWTQATSTQNPSQETWSLTIINTTHGSWSLLDVPLPIALAGGSSVSLSYKTPNNTSLFIPVLMWGSSDTYSFTFNTQNNDASSVPSYFWDPFLNTWRALNSNDIGNIFIPQGLVGTTLVQFGDHTGLIGGLGTTTNTLLMNVHVTIILFQPGQVSLTPLPVWWFIKYLPLSPPARREATSALVSRPDMPSNSGLLFVQGGWTQQVDVFAYMWFFNLTSSRWSPFSYISVIATARGVMVAFNDTLVLFGGVYETKSGVYFFTAITAIVNTTSITRTLVPPPTDLLPRAATASATIRDSLYIFGGYYCNTTISSDCLMPESPSQPIILKDFWVFSLTARNWTRLAESPGPRYFAAMAVAPKTDTWFEGVLLYGGQDASGNLLDDLWAFPTDRSFQWIPISLRWTYVFLNMPMILVMGNRVLFFSNNFTIASTPISNNNDDNFNSNSNNNNFALQVPSFFAHLPSSGIINLDSTTPFYETDTISVTYPSQCQIPMRSYTVLSNDGMLGAFAMGIEENNLCTAQLGCPLGFYSPNFAARVCQPCAIGFYSSTIGATSCSACPEGLTTSNYSSTSINDCTRCVADCGHGRCVVHSFSPGVAPQFSCSCSSFSSGPQCTFSGGFIALIVIVCLIAVALPLGMLCHWQRRKVKETRSELNERLLELSDVHQKLELFKDVFTIKYEDLTFVCDIGVGTFGRVQKAKLNNEFVAVKFLRHQGGGGAADPFRAYTNASFQRELKELRANRHPNILTFLGAGETDVQSLGLFLVTEFCDRGSLFDVLADESIEVTWPIAHNFTLQSAEGMRFLHTHGRVHRDLKSLNILVTKSWQLKIADFGAAKKMALDEEGVVRSNTISRLTDGVPAAAPTELGTIFSGTIGTIQWIPPEAHDSSTKLTFRGDVYSFGIIMWEIVARKTPYVEEEFGPNGRFLRKKIQGGLRPLLSHIPVERTNADYVELMQRCWHATPAMRPLFPDICIALEAMLPDHVESRHNTTNLEPKRMHPSLRPASVAHPRVTSSFSSMPFELISPENI
eukprot:m.74344 g.74344  ORF g.74344 m.74344 type:complete len:1330 (-) comp13083_c0_seq2:41-4030(-)